MITSGQSASYTRWSYRLIRRSKVLSLLLLSGDAPSEVYEIFRVWSEAQFTSH
jgi:hypothetical protein